MHSAFTGIAPLTPTLSPEGQGGAGGGVGEGAANSQPLTLTLSPEGRGDDVAVAGEETDASADAEALASPLRGEAAAQRRVRGRKSQPAQVRRARALRSEMTDAENRLWYHLRNRRLAGFKFVREYPIASYFADFACREAMLVIEADGGQHGGERDARRDRAIEAAGYRVLRFWNTDILSNTDGVLEVIASALALNPSPDLRFAPATLSPEGRGAHGASAATTKKRSYRLTAKLPRMISE